jgi:predicted transcriptional regulator
VAKLGKEQVMVAESMVARGASVRALAEQLGVTEGALRYRLKRRSEGEVPDGRSKKTTGVDGFGEAIETILRVAEDRRITGEGRPMQARSVYDVLVRDWSCPRSVDG